MSVDDLEVGKCPYCGGEIIHYSDAEGDWDECEQCGFREENK